MKKFTKTEQEQVSFARIYGWLYSAFKNSLWDGKCYQYTQLHVVDSFLAEGNLRATSMGFLNDTAEYMFGGSALNNNEVTTQSASRFFSCSFSKKADNIQQYMMYAGEIGVAVEFDFTFPQWFDNKIKIPSLSVVDMNDNIISLGAIYHPIKVEYVEEKDIEKKIKDEETKVETYQLDDRVHKDIVRSFIPCYMKKKGFQAESELRFAVPNYQGVYTISQDETDNNSIANLRNYRDWENYPTKVEFVKATNKLLKPYVNLFYSVKINKKSHKVGLPISSIWIGPGRDQQRAFNSVKMRLEYGGIKMFPLPIHQYVRRLKLFSIYCLGWLYRKNSAIFADTRWSEAMVTDITNLQEDDRKTISAHEQDILKKFSVHFKSLDQLIDGQHKDVIIGGPDKDATSGAVALAKKLYNMSYDILLKLVARRYKKYLESKIIPIMFRNCKNDISLKLKYNWCTKQAEKMLAEFFQFNYFSSIGIAVYCSMKDLSLV